MYQDSNWFSQPCRRRRPGHPKAADGLGCESIYCQAKMLSIYNFWSMFRFTNLCERHRIWFVAYTQHTPSKVIKHIFSIVFFPGVMGHAMRIPEICIFTNARSWEESLIRIGAALSNHVLPRHSGLSQGGRHPPSGPRGHLTDATDSEAAGLDQLKKAWGRSVWVSRCGSCGKQKPLCRSLVPIPNLRGGNEGYVI